MAALAAGVKRPRSELPEEAQSRTESSSVSRGGLRRRLESSAAQSGPQTGSPGSKPTPPGSVVHFPPGFIPLVPYYVFTDLVRFRALALLRAAVARALAPPSGP
jgi:hypothetical protein